MNPYYYLILAATLGGSGGIFVKALSLPVTTVAFFRFFVPAIGLGIFFLIKRIKPFHGNYAWMLFISILSAVRMIFYIIGFTSTTIGDAQVLFFTWPIFIVLFSILILKEKVSKRVWLLFLLAFMGVIVLFKDKEFSFSNSDFIGLAYILLTAILTGLMTVLIKKYIKEYSNIETIFYQVLVGALIFLPLFFYNYPLPTTGQLSIGILYGIVVGLIVWGLYFTALRKIKASYFSLLTYWEVPMAAIYASIFLKEYITLNNIIGALFIVGAGIFLIHSKEAKVT
jgi:drug/metabolite transporter (DMT)-like permease